MNAIQFSIIIPHKNIPSLLQRCLDSIPIRDDVQVIVVDDNSDPEKVDFNAFPGHDRKDVQIIFTKDGRGAGYARNTGLDAAVGKWLIFMDADDLFSDQYNSILDNSIDSLSDVLLFDHEARLSDDLSKKSLRDGYYHQLIQSFLDVHDIETEQRVRLTFHPLWGKIIRHSYVLENNIRFSEVGWSNDAYFSVRVGVSTEKMDVDDRCLYIVTQRSESLTSDFCGSMEETITRLREAIKIDDILKLSHCNELADNANRLLCLASQRMGIWSILRSCKSSTEKKCVLNFCVSVLIDKLHN